MLQESKWSETHQDHVFWTAAILWPLLKKKTWYRSPEDKQWLSGVKAAGKQETIIAGGGLLTVLGQEGRSEHSGSFSHWVISWMMLVLGSSLSCSFLWGMQWWYLVEKSGEYSDSWFVLHCFLCWSSWSQNRDVCRDWWPGITQTVLTCVQPECCSSLGIFFHARKKPEQALRWLIASVSVSACLCARSPRYLEGQRALELYKRYCVGHCALCFQEVSVPSRVWGCCW